MALKTGNILREKISYFKEKLKTRSGLFDLIIGNFAWGWLIIKYNKWAFEIIFTLFSMISWNWLRSYLTYTIFGLLLIPVSIGITMITTQVFKILNKLKKQLFGGK